MLCLMIVWKQLRRINPELNNSAIEQAIHEISIEKSPSLLENNRSFHEMITNGIEVEHYNDDGETINDLVYVLTLITQEIMIS
ncbi:type I restriction endonuclease [Staphylococcus aureus]